MSHSEPTPQTDGTFLGISQSRATKWPHSGFASCEGACQRASAAPHPPLGRDLAWGNLYQTGHRFFSHAGRDDPEPTDPSLKIRKMKVVLLNLNINLHMTLLIVQRIKG